MRTVTILTALIALFVIPSAEAKPVSLKVGIATYNMQRDDPNLFPKMRSLGMREVRLTLSAISEERDMAWLNEEIPLANANGIEIVVNLNQETSDDPSWFPAWCARMVISLPTVHRFIIGNEVNSPAFWKYGVAGYVKTLAATTRAIHHARPDATVSGFGLVSSHHPLLFLKQAVTAAKRYGGISNVMDSISLHVYTSPVNGMRLIRAAERLYSGLVYVDEAGWDARATGELTQAHSMVQLLKLTRQDSHICSLLFYRMQDESDDNSIQTGLERADGSVRPSWEAISHA